MEVLNVHRKRKAYQVRREDDGGGGGRRGGKRYGER